jgi:hypothetical protein
MKRENMQWIILNSIFLIIFNVAFFLLGGTDRKVSVWISYGFIHFACFMLLLTPKLTRGEKSWTALGFPLYVVSATYFLIALFIGVLFILIAPEGYTAALLIQLCIAGLYGIVLFANLIANEYTADAEEKRQYQVAYIKEVSVKLKELLENIGDKEVKKKVERVYDAIYSSPTKSHPDLAQIEEDILKSIRALERVISAGDKDEIINLARSLETAIDERNGRLKRYH